jgi:hypothetical protein
MCPPYSGLPGDSSNGSDVADVMRLPDGLVNALSDYGDIARE